jgi:hypothetical protein
MSALEALFLSTGGGRGEWAWKENEDRFGTVWDFTRSSSSDSSSDSSSGSSSGSVSDSDSGEGDPNQAPDSHSDPHSDSDSDSDSDSGYYLHNPCSSGDDGNSTWQGIGKALGFRGSPVFR